MLSSLLLSEPCYDALEECYDGCDAAEAACRDQSHSVLGCSEDYLTCLAECCSTNPKCDCYDPDPIIIIT